MERFCKTLLGEWCRSLMKLQVKGSSHPRLEGAILCPACGKIHGRCVEAMYPFLRMAKEEEYQARPGWQKRREEWIEGAKALFSWAEHTVSLEDGSLLNDIDSQWTGITVFYTIQLSDCLRFGSSLLDQETKTSWTRRLERAAEFLYNTHILMENNINYPISNALALYQCGEILGNGRYKKKAGELARLAGSVLTENGLVFGEGGSRLQKSRQGCRPVDIGYNIEETLPSLSLYAWESKDNRVWDLAEKSLLAHLDFILADGGINNSFGTRNYKWSYWGSRTCDGIGLGYLLAAKRLKRGQKQLEIEGAVWKNLELLKACTQDGLLSGGPHYRFAGQPSCVHHTFTHAKVLAGILDRELAKNTGPFLTDKRKENPCFNSRWYPEIASWQISAPSVSATVTCYDWEYMPGGHVGGGTLSLLHHKDAGPLFCAGMGEYTRKEPNNMQIPYKVRHQCLALRIEAEINGVLYSSIYEDEAKAESLLKNDSREISLKVQGQLKDISHNPPASIELPYCLEYRFLKNQVEINGAFPLGKLICPIISHQEEELTFDESAGYSVIKIMKNGGPVYFKTRGKMELPYKTERIFHLVPGFQALRVDITPLSRENPVNLVILM